MKKSRMVLLAVIAILIIAYFGLRGGEEGPREIPKSELKDNFTAAWSAATESVPQVVVDNNLPENVRENLSENELEDLKSALSELLVDVSQMISVEFDTLPLPEMIPAEDVENILGVISAKIENRVLGSLSDKIGEELTGEVRIPLAEELRSASSKAIRDTTTALGLGGWLLIGRGSDADRLDPARTKFDFAMHNISLINDTLLTYDLDMNLAPLLAKDWEIREPEYIENEDRWEVGYIEFILREDVKFHCGHPFTAEAVEYTIERIRNLSGSVHTDSVKGMTVQILDDYRVRIYFEPEKLTLGRYSIEWFATPSSSIVCPHCAGEPPDYDMSYGITHSCGTGPFKFKEWVKDLKVVLVRNDDYTWGPSHYQNRGPPHIAGVEFDVYPEPIVKDIALRKGDINFAMPWFAGGDLEAFREDPTINVYESTEMSIGYIGFHTGGGRFGTYDISTDQWHNITEGPTDFTGGKFVGDVRVRRAIAYAIDKPRFIEEAVDNVGEPLYGVLTPSHWMYWEGSENMYRYNPDKTREILEDVGFVHDESQNRWFHENTGEKLVITLICTDAYRSHSEVLLDMLDEVGIELGVNIIPFGPLSDIIGRRGHQAYLMGWNWPLVDILWWMYSPTRVPAPNRNWWDREGGEELMDNTLSFNDEVAEAAVIEAQKATMEDCVYIPLRVRGTTPALRSDVKGFTLHPWPYWTWKFLDVRVE